MVVLVVVLVVAVAFVTKVIWYEPVPEKQQFQSSKSELLVYETSKQ